MKIAFTVYKIKVCPTQIPLQDRWLLMLIPQNGLIIIEKYSQQFLCLCPTWGAHILSKWSSIVELEQTRNHEPSQTHTDHICYNMNNLIYIRGGKKIDDEGIDVLGSFPTQFFIK